MMGLLIVLILAIWIQNGSLWYWEALKASSDIDKLKKLMLINNFKDGNILGKILCALGMIILSPWIVLYLLFNSDLIDNSQHTIMGSIKKLCGWSLSNDKVEENNEPPHIGFYIQPPKP